MSLNVLADWGSVVKEGSDVQSPMILKPFYEGLKDAVDFFELVVPDSAISSDSPLVAAVDIGYIRPHSGGENECKHIWDSVIGSRRELLYKLDAHLVYLRREFFPHSPPGVDGVVDTSKSALVEAVASLRTKLQLCLRGHFPASEDEVEVLVNVINAMIVDVEFTDTSQLLESIVRRIQMGQSRGIFPMFSTNRESGYPPSIGKVRDDGQFPMAALINDLRGIGSLIFSGVSELTPHERAMMLASVIDNLGTVLDALHTARVSIPGEELRAGSELNDEHFNWKELYAGSRMSPREDSAAQYGTDYRRKFVFGTSYEIHERRGYVHRLRASIDVHLTPYRTDISRGYCGGFRRRF